MKNYTEKDGRANRQEFVIKAAIEIMSRKTMHWSTPGDEASKAVKHAWDLAERLLDAMPEKYQK